MSTVPTWIFHMVILIVGLKIRDVVKCFLTKDETSAWAQTKSFKIIQVLIYPETTWIWYFGVRVKQRLCVHVSLMANEPQNASNGSQFQIQVESDFCRNHSFKYFSNSKDWWRLSVLIFEWRHKVAQFSALLSSSAELLRIWSTLGLVHSVASTELRLASKIHNNSRKVWEKVLTRWAL